MRNSHSWNSHGETPSQRPSSTMLRADIVGSRRDCPLAGRAQKHGWNMGEILMKIKVGIQGQALYSMAYKGTDFLWKALFWILVYLMNVLLYYIHCCLGKWKLISYDAEASFGEKKERESIKELKRRGTEKWCVFRSNLMSDSTFMNEHYTAIKAFKILVFFNWPHTSFWRRHITQAWLIGSLQPC